MQNGAVAGQSVLVTQSTQPSVRLHCWPLGH
jgi:hypothetical protein